MSSGPRAPKRGPTVLVTDSREQRPSQSRPQIQRPGTRLISVDNVLQYASEIPSGQRRGAPDRPGSGGSLGGGRSGARTPSGRHPLDPRLSGRNAPSAIGSFPPLSTHLPARSSKTSEKLVLLPETSEEAEEEEEKEEGEEDLDGFAEEDTAPPADEEIQRRRMKLARGKSMAERLPKSQRTTEGQLARVTAYCTAQSYKLRSTAQFVREQHAAKTKLYDDCLYCVYQLPLLGGSEGYRVRSSPVVKNPGGRSVLDEQIEANEARQYRDGWVGESDEYSVRGNEYAGLASPPPPAAGSMSAAFGDTLASTSEHTSTYTYTSASQEQEQEWGQHSSSSDGTQPFNTTETHDHAHRRESSDSSGGAFSFASPQPAISPNATSTAELFIFSYGVAVLWNFTANQEKDLLADLTFSSMAAATNLVNPHAANGKAPGPTSALSQKNAAPLSTTPLMTRPLPESDFETEEFHFEYNPRIRKPRIYNDMITLRTSDHMVKLGMSHAIAQSTKLSFFEERMQRTMAAARDVPRRLALEGRLGMSRTEVVGLVGRLFEGRVDVNLSSNMLDTPSFFWDSEPTLHPLYAAVREYLEIKPRIQVLNERCRVFLDLAEILSDSIADTKMTRITWIIIVLILLSIIVTCTEVFLRFGILASGKAKEGKGMQGSTAVLAGMGVGSL